MTKKYKRVLTIAGSDSGGGAGIQADIKAISAIGCFATTAITAVTVQNTQGVTNIHPVPADIVKAQIDAVLSDIGTDAVKIGMLHSTTIIEIVARTLKEYMPPCIVLDPVMVATSGDKLIEDNTIDVLKKILIPLTDLITPNIPEAELLSGKEIRSLEQIKKTGHELAENYKTAVLIKGGHLNGEKLYDVLSQPGDKQPVVIQHPMVSTKNTHGTGCTLSSAIAAFLAKEKNTEKAVNKGISYVHQALVHGKEYDTGKGNGPVNHFLI